MKDIQKRIEETLRKCITLEEKEAVKQILELIKDYGESLIPKKDCKERLNKKLMIKLFNARSQIEKAIIFQEIYELAIDQMRSKLNGDIKVINTIRK